MRMINEEVARGLAAEHGTPLFVTFEEILERNFRTLRRHLPRAHIYYAAKANPDYEILRTLMTLGCNLEVASPGELEMCRQLNLDPARILYTHPIKKEREIRLFRDFGLQTFVCDNAEEIKKLARVFNGASVFIRIRIKNPYCVVNLSEKFGCSMLEFPQLARLAVDEGLDLAGLCFHVGSQTLTPKPYLEALRTVRRLVDDLEKRGVGIRTIDIGGGFPVRYLKPIMPMAKFLRPINDLLDELFPGIEIISEPGRFLVGGASLLVTSIVGKSVREGRTWYYIDEGLYGSLSGKVFDHADYPMHSFTKGKKRRCIIAGPTCDSFDVPFRDRRLPDLEVGDILVVESLGAYSVAHATQFNSIPLSKRVFVPRERHE